MRIESGKQNVTGVHSYRSPLLYWVWSVFCANAIVAVVFTILCGLTYKEFLNVVTVIENQEAKPPEGISTGDWNSLFKGAAENAAFAVICTVGFHAVALLLLLCSFRSLAHPTRQFGRAFVMASSWWIGLHVLNIALAFWSFNSIMSTLHSAFQAPFNTTLLQACVAFGLINAVLYALFGCLLFGWRDHPELLQVERMLQSSAPV